MHDINGLGKEEIKMLCRLFVSSGRGYLTESLEALDELQTSGASEKMLESLHRSIHSLKGAALQMGITHVGSLALAIEKVVEATRRTGDTLSHEGIDILRDGVERLNKYLDCFEAEEECAEPPADLMNRLQALVDSMANGGMGSSAVGQ